MKFRVKLFKNKIGPVFGKMRHLNAVVIMSETKKNGGQLDLLYSSVLKE